MGKFALLIGVSDYSENLPTLPSATQDVAAMKRMLGNPDLGGFQVQTLLNPMREALAQNIERWLNSKQADDTVLLYFSGHGLKDEQRNLYIGATNTEKVRGRLVLSTAFSANVLHDYLRFSRIKTQIVILDCCFSGAFGDVLVKDDGEVALTEQLSAEGRVVLTSTSSVDYSFEEKESGLSIYTRYLVEGVEKGTADANGDGVITIDELHQFARRKVCEASPAMSPKLIALKDEGYRVVIAQAPKDEPELQYRKEVEKKVRSGKFTIPAQRKLMSLRRQCGLSDSVAAAIEAEVVAPYQEYERKLGDYCTTLKQSLEEEPSLSLLTIADLKDYQQHLGLRDEDVLHIEQSVAGQILSSAYEEPEPSKTRSTNSTQSHPETKSNSSSGIEKVYEILELSLKNRQWQKANDITRTLMYVTLKNKTEAIDIDVIHDEIEYSFSADIFSPNALINFPCDVLVRIDKLWMKYSKGRYGFTFQKEVYHKCHGLADGRYYGEAFQKYGDAVGWRENGSWRLLESEMQWVSSAPKGHLPVLIFPLLYYSVSFYPEEEIEIIGRAFCALISRFGDCNL
ncbi:GUN4 domain-containing protein [Leptolyngbya cf. ectocarpi LEGE 11479]|uniref:GUN4 domain-containing protein n=1 Tax=Leptolyngbya cf. ectocarpi LEGE 11479 TaxID=1828722 RepID=A0A928ZTE1_LEPEC|nr:GUN4 domain-containing protein [Leptolyngbya ectocarpi]MBE9067151.1 GUN4 domain-containing protein [Leptolyngbya cf. ectocarpi LEGE 11479]